MLQLDVASVQRTPNRQIQAHHQNGRRRDYHQGLLESERIAPGDGADDTGANGQSCPSARDDDANGGTGHSWEGITYDG